MMRLLVTGGTGYLGSALVRTASARGHTVAATYYSRSLSLSGDITWLPLDIRDAFSVEEALDHYRPNLVIHTAFRQNDPDLQSVTVEGTRHVARAATLFNARLIHMSSDVIFDGERSGAYTEEDQPAPISAYGAAKAAAEAYVTELDPAATIIRTSLIYGFAPIDRHTQFALDLVAGRGEGRLFDDEIRCPIFVDDLVEALLEVVGLPFKGVLNLAGAEALSRYAFGQALVSHYGYDPAILQRGLSSESPVRRPRNCALDISRARNLLRTPLRGVSEVLAAYRAG